MRRGQPHQWCGPELHQSSQYALQIVIFSFDVKCLADEEECGASCSCSCSLSGVRGALLFRQASTFVCGHNRTSGPASQSIRVTLMTSADVNKCAPGSDEAGEPEQTAAFAQDPGEPW